MSISIAYFIEILEVFNIERYWYFGAFLLKYISYCYFLLFFEANVYGDLAIQNFFILFHKSIRARLSIIYFYCEIIDFDIS